MTCSPSSDFPFPIPPFPVSSTSFSVLLLVALTPFLPILSYLTPLSVPVLPSPFLESRLFLFCFCATCPHRHTTCCLPCALALPALEQSWSLSLPPPNEAAFIPWTHQQDHQCSHHALICMWETPGGTQMALCQSGVWNL